MDDYSGRLYQPPSHIAKLGTFISMTLTVVSSRFDEVITIGWVFAVQLCTAPYLGC
jgi:hypothetical protein